MNFKKTLLFSVIILIAWPLCIYAENNKTQDADQQINDFSLSGYGDQGKKTWDLKGKSADIFTDTVALKDIEGHMYGDKDNIKLTADAGDYNKAQSKVHLQDHVVVTTESGAKLTTDSLDWDRKNQLVTTKDQVDLTRENMVLVAQGAAGQPDLSKVTLEKEVTLEINPVEKKDESGKVVSSMQGKVVITCDGPLEINYQQNIATFKNNVKVDRIDSQIYSDAMDVYFLRSVSDEPKETEQDQMLNSKIDKIVARGNVKIVNGQNTSYSDEAVYTASDKKILLSGKPKLVIFQTEAVGASIGN